MIYDSNYAMKLVVSDMKQRAKELGMPRAHLDKFDGAIFAIELLEKMEDKNAERNALRAV